MSVRVKICGVTRVEDAELAIALGADIIGLNFYPASPRALTLEAAQKIRSVVANRCAVAGVFVNAARDHIEEHRRALALDLIQFHGGEDDAAFAGWPVKVIRALRLRDENPAELIAHSRADYVLLDTFDPKLFGGTGKPHALDALVGLNLTRVIISGGLTPDNVAAAAALNPYAVDVASGVESAPGIKDHAKLRSFIVNAKSSR
jgi:phosphoribosylanthranilate isomerase